MEPSVKAIEILKLYKQLNRTVQIVFKGDIRALNAAKDKIRSEFEEKRNIKETKSIKELMKYGQECDQVLRTQVIQAVKVEGKDNVYRAPVTENTLVDNAIYRDDITDAEYKASIRAARKNKRNKSCQDKRID